MIEYLIKFVSQEAYANDLLDGILFMHCARYYHMLEEKYGPGQGDMREASILPGIAMYKNASFPIYCMYSVDSDEIIDGNIVIARNIIEEFSCENGYLVLINYKQFIEAIKRCDTHGYQLDAGLVSYGMPNKDLTIKLFEPDEIGNLFIKHPFFKYQKEYRIVVCKTIREEWEMRTVDGKEMKVLSPEKMIATYQIQDGLKNCAVCYEISKQRESNGILHIPVNIGKVNR